MSVCKVLLVFITVLFDPVALEFAHGESLGILHVEGAAQGPQPGTQLGHQLAAGAVHREAGPEEAHVLVDAEEWGGLAGAVDPHIGGQERLLHQQAQPLHGGLVLRLAELGAGVGIQQVVGVREFQDRHLFLDEEGLSALEHGSPRGWEIRLPRPRGPANPCKPGGCSTALIAVPA